MIQRLFLAAGGHGGGPAQGGGADLRMTEGGLPPLYPPEFDLCIYKMVPTTNTTQVSLRPAGRAAGKTT